MATRSPTPRVALHALALAAACGAATAQVTAQVMAPERITITAPPLAGVAGFGGQPLAVSPLQASVFGAGELLDAGAGTLAGLTLLDAGLSDAYNAEGYWSALTVRGFVIDNRSNYRRDGLPINAETALGLANKERIEVLKGTSGIQAGVSAPGGLVNLAVKRPNGPRREARVDLGQGGTVGARVDLGDRFGDGGRFGWRLNAEATELQPPTRAADGQRRLLALAVEAQAGPDTRLEAEVELSRQRQPTVPGFSLRGDTLPDASAIDPRINLNNQPWSLPTVLDGDTASLRWRQRLAGGWQFTAHGATQRLRSDDRVAFPFGCYDAGADAYYADRYCPDGTFDLYDFRSDGERRRTDALDLQLAGRAAIAGVEHDVSAGVLVTRLRADFNRQAFNYVGTGRDDGSLVTPADPTLTDENTTRDERSTEWYLRDAMTLAPAWTLWAGLRHTRLDRETVRTDGSRATAYAQAFTTPWLAMGYRWAPGTLVYASWGQGIETDVAPNRARYVNAGQPLPALKTRQWEAGVKHARDDLEWSVAAFRIERPLAADLGACDVDASCLRARDGSARHQGLEATLALRQGPWGLQGSAMWLDAQREGAADPAANGLRPTNVPRHALKALLARELPGLPGVQASARVVHEGSRMVLPDNSVEAPAWTRLDLGLRWAFDAAGAGWVARAGIDNVTDERAWRDAPYQFGHAYLFPLPGRAWRMSLAARF